jgi:hypothetical protein
LFGRALSKVHGLSRVEIIRRLTSYASEVPIEDVAAHDVRVGDVVRLDDPQAHRVERVVRVDSRVVLELRPVGLEISETVRATLPEDRLVSRLGTTAD